MLVIAQDKGEYIGFDTAEFTSGSGGKPAAIKAIKVNARQRGRLSAFQYGIDYAWGAPVALKCIVF